MLCEHSPLKCSCGSDELAIPSEVRDGAYVTCASCNAVVCHVDDYQALLDEADIRSSR
ncbi:hypothetical protein [Halomonas shantousis]